MEGHGDRLDLGTECAAGAGLARGRLSAGLQYGLGIYLRRRGDGSELYGRFVLNRKASAQRAGLGGAGAVDGAPAGCHHAVVEILVLLDRAAYRTADQHTGGGGQHEALVSGNGETLGACDPTRHHAAVGTVRLELAGGHAWAGREGVIGACQYRKGQERHHVPRDLAPAARGRVVRHGIFPPIGMSWLSLPGGQLQQRFYSWQIG